MLHHELFSNIEEKEISKPMNLYSDLYTWYCLTKLLLQTIIKMNNYNTKYIEFEISIWAEKMT